MPPPHEKTSPSPPSPVRDLYETLNIPRKASSREIRRAYRELARRYHPDFNPGDQAAAQNFRELQEAYEVLGNSRKRKAYDYYGPNFSGRIPSRAPSRTPAPSADPGRGGAVSDARANQAEDTVRDAARRFATIYPYLYQSSALFPRLASRSQLACLIIAAVFVFGAVLYVWLPNLGAREFERAREALRHVTSWKMEGRIVGSDSAGGEYLEEVSCPSSQHTTQHIRGTAANSREMVLETIQIGSDRYTYGSYSQIEGAKPWSRFVAGLSETCAKLSSGEDVGQLPPLHRWSGGAYVIEKENLRETADGACREWKVLIPGAYSSAPNAEFVCLGVGDHLPRFVGVPGSAGEVHFYDWNVPIDIQPPDVAPAPR